jgi:hypothetical protein
MHWKQYKLLLAVILAIISFPSIVLATRAQIHADYCYQYGDSESLMVAKEISYAMALRKAIEQYKTFVVSTSTVEDFQLKEDLIQTIASGYVEDIQIIKQDVRGRTVCTELIGYVDPDAVEGLVGRRIQKPKKIADQARKTVILQDGTPVYLVLPKNLSPSEVAAGEIVQFEVLRDVEVSGFTIIDKGAEAWAIIIRDEERDVVGQEAKLSFSMDSVTASDGRLLKIKTSIHSEGKDRMSEVAVLSWGVCALFGLIKGGDVVIPAGTEYKVYISGDYRFKIEEGGK